MYFDDNLYFSLRKARQRCGVTIDAVELFNRRSLTHTLNNEFKVYKVKKHDINSNYTHFYEENMA